MGMEIRFPYGRDIEDYPGTVSVLSSSFNPPTLAHHDLAGIMQLGAPAMYLLSIVNPDKGAIVPNDLRHRLRMMNMQRNHTGGVVAYTRAGLFVDQAKALSEKFPGSKFSFAMGADTFARVIDPKYYDDTERQLSTLVESGHSIKVAPRHPVSGDDLARLISDSPLASITTVVDLGVGSGLSSTEVRAQFARGVGSPGVWPEIMRYIQRHGLYRQ